MADALECYLCAGCGDPFDASGSGVTKIETIGGLACQSCSKSKAGSGV